MTSTYPRSETIVHDCGGIPDCHCGVSTAREPVTETYDEHLLRLARELADLKDLTDMRRWMADHDVIIPGADVTTVYAYILGRTMGTMTELARWVERIPEAHRG